VYSVWKTICFLETINLTSGKIDVGPRINRFIRRRKLLLKYSVRTVDHRMHRVWLYQDNTEHTFDARRVRKNSHAHINACLNIL